jgi:hypothetical protein
MTSDDRLTSGLILDVLERHGYHRYDNQHTGQAVGAILDLAYVYDGTRNASYGTYLDHPPPGPHTEPGPSDPDADDAVILTGAEVSTVVAALDIAADYKRDRAGTCADCAGQSCTNCQWRLQAAGTYDQLVGRMIHAAEASAPQRAPGHLAPPSVGPHAVAGKEAGQ